MQINEQQVFDAIKIHFDTDKRRVKFISYLIVSLLKITTCALSEWSRAIAQPTQRASRYKRLQRFVSQFCFSSRIYARLVWSVFGQGKQVVLTLDRTEYQKRGQWIQVLMLGIAHQGISIPLIWHTTNRRGNASEGTRKALLIRFFKPISYASSVSLVGCTESGCIWRVCTCPTAITSSLPPRPIYATSSVYTVSGGRLKPCSELTSHAGFNGKTVGSLTIDVFIRYYSC